jgi:hypothetical protein
MSHDIREELADKLGPGIRNAAFELRSGSVTMPIKYTAKGGVVEVDGGIFPHRFNGDMNSVVSLIYSLWLWRLACFPRATETVAVTKDEVKTTLKNI